MHIQTTGDGIGYVPTILMLPSTVERLFSVSGWSLSDSGNRITPEHFEKPIFPFVISHYWNLTGINAFGQF